MAPLFNFNIQNLYSLISTYLNNPFLYRIDSNTYGFKIKNLSRQTIIILCKSKSSISSEIQRIPLTEFYWNSFQIRSIVLSKDDSMPHIPTIELKYNDTILKSSLTNIKVINKKTIAGYPEFSLLMIDDENNSVIENLYQALKFGNVLIYLNN